MANPYDHPPVNEVDDGKWRDDAACQGENGDDWFPPRAHQRHFEATAHARSVCATCPVQTECLDYAMTNHIVHGIWGGKSVRERRDIRRIRNNPTIPPNPPRRPALVLQPEDWSTMARSPYNPTQRAAESDG